MPGMLDWFGWCTWDAFYQDVNPQGIRDGLKRFMLAWFYVYSTFSQIDILQLLLISFEVYWWSIIIYDAEGIWEIRKKMWQYGGKSKFVFLILYH